ncbi:DUF4240 domain-containing protein [bacterium]|nr:DUF4240 domain-containing protein [bacterium]
MIDEKFWKLIEQSGAGRADCEEQVENLIGILARLPAQEIIEFDRILLEKRILAYRWDLWGVAFIINGGCSDDGFEYFRCWLIGQGREAFERVLQDPESVADLTDEHGIECEDLLYVASQAYERVTGSEMPMVKRIYPNEPVGEPWDESDLSKKFSKVSRKFE